MGAKNPSVQTKIEYEEEAGAETPGLVGQTPPQSSEKRKVARFFH